MKKHLYIFIMAIFSFISLTVHAENPKVYFIEPQNGSTHKNPVKVVFGLQGMGVAPAGVQNEKTGHHHLIVDAPLPDLKMPIPADEHHLHFGGGQTETTITLKPGTHTLQLVLGDYKHQAHPSPVVSEKITISVE